MNIKITSPTASEATGNFKVYYNLLAIYENWCRTHEDSGRENSLEKVGSKHSDLHCNCPNHKYYRPLPIYSSNQLKNQSLERDSTLIGSWTKFNKSDHSIRSTYYHKQGLHCVLDLPLLLFFPIPYSGKFSQAIIFTNHQQTRREKNSQFLISQHGHIWPHLLQLKQWP